MSATVESVNWRFVEVGRVVMLTGGAERDQRAVIVEIIDHKRVLVDGPSFQRRAISVNRIVLTPHIISNLPRGARTATVISKWKSSKFDEVWAKSAWAKKIDREKKRSTLSDFDRFRVMVLKKQKRYAVQKAAAKA